MVNVSILDDVAVSPARHLGERWAFAFPTSCRLRDGGILCAYRRGKEKHSRDGIFLVQRSDDDGRSWSEPQTIHDSIRASRPESVHAGTVVEAGDGAVVAMFTAVEIGDSSDAYIFSATGRHLEQRFYTARSDDGGRSWSPPVLCALPDTPPLRYINSRPLALPDGSLLVPVEVTMGDKSQAVMTGHYDVATGIFSPFQAAAHDLSGRLSFGDPKLVTLPNGSVLMWLWAFLNETEETVAAHVCLSRDNGKTWSAPRPTSIHCQAAALLGLTGQNLIVAGNVRTPPEGMRLWHSADAGERWEDASPIQMWDARRHTMLGVSIEERARAQDPSDGKLWESLPGFTFGSPDLVSAGDSVNLLTYYVMVDGFAEVRACRFVVN